MSPGGGGSSARALDRRDAGMLLGALLAADEAPRALERLFGAAKGRCQRELEALARVDRGARLARSRELASHLLLPGPQRIGLIHPSWLAHVLQRLHPAVAAATVEALPPSLAAELSSHAGPCGLPTAARLRLVQGVLDPFEELDGSALTDGSLESWLVDGASSFLAPLERLAADPSAPKEALALALERLKAEARPLALGGVMAFKVLETLGAERRLLWRLPRSIGRWVEGASAALPTDAAWSTALAVLLEDPS